MMKACGLQMINKMAKISEIGITERHIASDGLKCEQIILLQINSNPENEIV